MGTPGCFAGDTRFILSDGKTASFAELVERGITETEIKAYDERSGRLVNAAAKEIRIEKYADELQIIELKDGTAFRCTDTHLIMDEKGAYIPAKEIKEGQLLSGGHTVMRVCVQRLPEKSPFTI